MKRMNIRAFALVCLKAATGRSVLSELQAHLRSGLSLDALITQAEEHRVMPLLAPALEQIGVYTGRPHLKKHFAYGRSA